MSIPEPSSFRGNPEQKDIASPEDLEPLNTLEKRRRIIDQERRYARQVFEQYEQGQSELHQVSQDLDQKIAELQAEAKIDELTQLGDWILDQAREYFLSPGIYVHHAIKCYKATGKIPARAIHTAWMRYREDLDSNSVPARHAAIWCL